VTDTKRLHFYMHGELVADVPANDLVLGGGAPVYHREYREPAYYKKTRSLTSTPCPTSGTRKNFPK
jgi:phosphoribosylformylglycinamidine synthase